MSQRTARHDPRARSADEDIDDVQARQPERKQGVRPHEPGEPDEGDLELIGGDDLSDVDLGPAAPNFTDPDAPSGRMRK